MKNFIKYIIKPMAIISCIPFLGVLSYWMTQRKDLLAISLILYFSVIIGGSIKYFYANKSNQM